MQAAIGGERACFDPHAKSHPLLAHHFRHQLSPQPADSAYAVRSNGPISPARWLHTTPADRRDISAYVTGLLWVACERGPMMSTKASRLRKPATGLPAESRQSPNRKSARALFAHMPTVLIIAAPLKRPRGRRSRRKPRLLSPRQICPPRCASFSTDRYACTAAQTPRFSRASLAFRLTSTTATPDPESRRNCLQIARVNFAAGNSVPRKATTTNHVRHVPNACFRAHGSPGTRKSAIGPPATASPLYRCSKHNATNANRTAIQSSWHVLIGRIGNAIIKSGRRCNRPIQLGRHRHSLLSVAEISLFHRCFSASRALCSPCHHPPHEAAEKNSAD